jgi:hypothetical protein
MGGLMTYPDHPLHDPSDPTDLPPDLAGYGQPSIFDHFDARSIMPEPPTETLNDPDPRQPGLRQDGFQPGTPTRKLIPKRVTVESSLKPFRSTDLGGASDGTSMSIEFEVPDGMDGRELRKAILSEKEHLDLLVLASERMKGAVSHELYQSRKKMLKASYDTALGRTQGEDLVQL